MNGKLYLVPTPIGNLGDMTYRAVEILKEVSLILAEDTRVTGKLLHHFEIQTPMQPFHMHNEHQKVSYFVQKIQNGETLAMVTDAGTPGISDPGYLLAKACIAENIVVECLPGATAFVPALVVSGLASNSFVFEGFLPLKKGRKTKLESLAKEFRTIILYESPHKINKTLAELVTYFGEERKASLSRELSKKFEETIRGTLQELVTISKERILKGEMVLVIDAIND